MRSSAQFSLLAIIFLLGALFSAKFGNNEYRIQKIKVPNTPILTVESLLYVDSMVVLDPEKQLSYTISPVEYINNHQAVFHLRNNQLSLADDSLNVVLYGAMWLHPVMKISSFSSYFAYFQTYDKRNFLRYFNIGGLALLFFFSMITVIITRKPILFFYNIIVLYNLILIIFREFHFHWLHLVSFDSVANLVLYLLFILLYWLLYFYERWSLSSLTDFPIPYRPLIGFVMVFFVLQLPIHHHDVIVWAQRFILLIAIVLIGKRTIKAIKYFEQKFRWYIYFGYMMMFLQWMETFHILPIVTATITVIILAVLTFLGISISQFILDEFSRTRELSQQRFRLQKQLGQLQIISLEQERQLLYDRLNNDVIHQLDEITKSMDSVEISEQTKTVSKLTGLLQSIRDYSYSLFPPYLDKLDMLQLIHREIEKIFPQQQLLFTLEIDDSIRFKINNEQKLWLFRVFQSYMSFYNLGNQQRKIHVSLEVNDLDLMKFKLLHEISSLHLPIYQSYTHSKFFGYAGFSDVSWNQVLTNDVQGWELEIPIEFKRDEN